MFTGKRGAEHSLAVREVGFLPWTMSLFQYTENTRRGSAMVYGVWWIGSNYDWVLFVDWGGLGPCSVAVCFFIDDSLRCLLPPLHGDEFGSHTIGQVENQPGQRCDAHWFVQFKLYQFKGNQCFQTNRALWLQTKSLNIDVWQKDRTLLWTFRFSPPAIEEICRSEKLILRAR